MFKLPFYPTTPANGVTRLERLLFLRRKYIYSMAVMLPLLVVRAVLFSTVVIVVAAPGFFFQALGLGSRELRLRAERRGNGS